MNLSAESQRELERLMGLVTVYLLRHGQANRVELESALSALLEKLARTEAEVDRLDGIRGELTTERDEARREAAGWRDTAAEMLGHYREVHPLPWELGAPAAGREEGT